MHALLGDVLLGLHRKKDSSEKKPVQRLVNAQEKKRLETWLLCTLCPVDEQQQDKDPL